MYADEKKHGEQTIEVWREILLDAADIIDEYGWFSCGPPLTNGRVCAAMAINRAAASFGRETYPAFCLAIKQLDGYLRPEALWSDDHPVNCARHVVCWNDAPGRTAEEVTGALRACARQ